MVTELVRLPVAEGGAEPLLAYMRGHEYFRQEAILSSRFFANEDEPEVLVIVEWRSRGAMEAAGESELSAAFRAGVAPLLAGAPQLGFYAGLE